MKMRKWALAVGLMMVSFFGGNVEQIFAMDTFYQSYHAEPRTLPPDQVDPLPDSFVIPMKDEDKKLYEGPVDIYSSGEIVVYILTPRTLQDGKEVLGLLPLYRLNHDDEKLYEGPVGVFGQEGVTYTVLKKDMISDGDGGTSDGGTSDGGTSDGGTSDGGTPDKFCSTNGDMTVCVGPVKIIERKN